MVRTTLFTLSVFLLSFFLIPPIFWGKEPYAEGFDTSLNMQSNGQLTVTEVIKYRFEGRPLTDVFRKISQSEVGGIAFLQASMDGITFPRIVKAGQKAPRWQSFTDQKQEAVKRAFCVGAIAGFSTLVLGGLLLFSFVRSNARDLKLPTQTRIAHPPDDLSPALVGRLTGVSNSFLGTIFDLAQRGIIEIKAKEGRWGVSNYILAMKNVATDLTPHDRRVLEVVFNPNENQVDLTKVGIRLVSEERYINDPLDQELIHRGWVDLERHRKRMNMVLIGMLGMSSAIGLFLVGVIVTGLILMSHPVLAQGTAVLAGFGCATFVLSISLLIYGSTFSPLTPTGEEQRNRWQGFAEYLKQVSKGKEEVICPEIFEQYLPYAVALGLGVSWAKAFQKHGDMPMPFWFQTIAESDFSSIVAAVIAADSAVCLSSADIGIGVVWGGIARGVG